MNRTRRATLAGLLIALIVAAGYSLAGVPNVELVTLLIFVSGFLIGPRLGAAVGAASWGLYSALNPMGAALPPILIVQIVSGSVFGIAGGYLGPLILERVGRLAGMFLCGLAGLAMTLCFQIAVNTAAYFAAAGIDVESSQTLWTFVAGGIAFTLMHLVWNTAVFAMTLRPIMSVLDRYRLELSR
jgi:hypothetical protein